MRIKTGFSANLSKKVSVDENCINRIEKLLELSENNKFAGLVITLLRVDNPFSAGNQYKILELIREDCGKNVPKGLLPKESGFTISDFTHSLNDPYGVGIKFSRHSLKSGDVANPMSIRQCQEYLWELMDNWIDFRTSTTNEDTHT